MDAFSACHDTLWTKGCYSAWYYIAFQDRKNQQIPGGYKSSDLALKADAEKLSLQVISRNHSLALQFWLLLGAVYKYETIYVCVCENEQTRFWSI